MAWLDRRTFMLVLAVLVAGIPRTDCSSGEECEELICYPKADMALAGLNASHERLADACGDLGTWMDGTLLGASVYDPTHLEKFREMAMGEKKMVKTPCWQTRSGTWHFRPRQRSFWLLTMVSGRRVQYLRQECCISSKRASEEASADASLCNDDGERVLLVPPGPDAAQRMCLLSRNHQDVIDSVDQIAIKAGTCYEEEGEREEMKTAAFFSWLHSWIEARDLVAFSSKRRRRGLRDAELADGLYAAGFSREICSYEIGMRRRGRGEGRRTDVEDPVKGRSSCRVGDEFELPWEQHHVLQHFMHACDQRLKEHEGAGAGAGAGAAEATAGSFAMGFTGSQYAASLRQASLLHAQTCARSCRTTRGCRSWTWWDGNLLPSREEEEEEEEEEEASTGVCVLCADVRWQPFRNIGTMTGYNIFALLNTSVPSSTDVEVERSTWNFIEEEPRGGWTLADVVGFPFSSDIVMPLFSWRSSRLLPAESPCARKPKAAVIYLVGPREFDLESLRASLRALEIHFLRPHSFCYPVFLFREEWDQDLIAMIQTWTAANVEFLVADMSFPANFNPGGRTSVHSKRSAWGYQHMSRFWVRGVFEHAAVRELEMFMRLDTDSFFATPLLDVFQDAQERNISYGYRQAGKDWTGKTRGLWRFHLQYMKDTSSSCLETGQGPGAGAGAGDSKGLLLRLLGYPNISEDADVAMFYTNFELVSVRRFVQEDVWSYVKALDESHGIYLNGWGDAQIRWMQIATFLELRQVHRFCHFAYIHSAAGTKAFDCWQEPWIGYTCPEEEVCDLRGRASSRLLEQEDAHILLGPQISFPARSLSVLVYLQGRKVFASSPSLRASRFHVLLLGPNREVLVQEGEIASEGERGRLLLHANLLNSHEAALNPMQVKAMLVEISLAFQDFGSQQPGDREERLLLLLPSASFCRSQFEGMCEDEPRRTTCLQDGGVCVSIADEREEAARREQGAGEGEAAFLDNEMMWNNMMVLSMIAGEYTSRHLKTKSLPPQVSSTLASYSIFSFSAAARSFILHLVVLAILQQPTASRVLDEFLFLHQLAKQPPTYVEHAMYRRI